MKIGDKIKFIRRYKHGPRATQEVLDAEIVRIYANRVDLLIDTRNKSGTKILKKYVYIKNIVS